MRRRIFILKHGGIDHLISVDFAQVEAAILEYAAGMSGIDYISAEFAVLQAISGFVAVNYVTAEFAVLMGGSAPTINSSLTATATQGTAFSYTITSVGSLVTTYSITGSLPAGLTFDGVKLIHGTPS